MTLECELVQDFLEMETVVQHPKPTFSLNLSSFDFFLFTLLKNSLSILWYEPQSAIGSAIVQNCTRCALNIYLIAFRARKL